ncbi:DNA-directed RNA polymerase subunit beta' domain protein [Mycobacterium xenopi 3993]|nr:DNA-directed RNA polymerase subunit beta' domain protein [Mycobacterium xenopi 3993]
MRQMLRRVTIIDSGSTEFLPGSLIDRPSSRPRTDGWWPRAASRRRPSGVDGDHQGVAGHRLVAVGGVVPGDHASVDRCGDQLPQRQAQRSEGERDHRQADPGRYRNRPLPQHPGAADRGGPAAAYTIPSYEDQYYSPDFGQATGAAVPLDDYGYGDYR